MPLHPLQVVVSQGPSNLRQGTAKARVAFTGGTGGLSLQMAEHLATAGQASHITLISRTGRLDAVAAQKLLMSDAVVTITSADVSMAAEADAVWSGADGRADDAVFHASGVLEVRLRGLDACMLVQVSQDGTYHDIAY